MTLYEIPFRYFNDQPITPKYYDILNDDDDDENNIPGNPFDNVLLWNKILEDSVMPNDKDIDDEIIIDDADSLISATDPNPKNKFREFKD